MGERDKRRHERRQTLIEVRLAVLERGGSIAAPFDGALTDLSQGGAAIRTPKMLHAGTRLAMLMKTKAGHTVYGLSVLNVRYEPGVGYIAGCAWLGKDHALPGPYAFGVVAAV